MPVNFDDLTNRILDKLDKFEGKLDTSCDRLTEVEHKLENHLRQLENEEKNKEKRFYIIIALMGLAFSAFEIIKLVT